jgi:hypothetical protein
MTPHIIRNAQITQEDLAPIWVGTEQNITFRGGSPRVESEVEGPFDSNEGSPEEIQDAIRRRLQRLPRGLRPGDNGESAVVPGAPGQPPNPQQPPQGGVNLVPAAPPSSIFQPRTPPGAPSTQPATPPEDDQPPAGLVSQRPASATAASLAAAPAVRLWLVPGRLTVAPGDTFEVRVQAEAGQPVSHLPLSLSFDPAVLAVDKVDGGEFLGGAGEAQVMSDFGRPGALVIGASRLGKVPGVKGTGTVARITFRAVAAGSSGLSLDGKALDGSLRPLAVHSRPALIEVRAEPALRPAAPAAPRREASASGRR